MGRIWHLYLYPQNFFSPKTLANFKTGPLLLMEERQLKCVTISVIQLVNCDLQLSKNKILLNACFLFFFFATSSVFLVVSITYHMACFGKSHDCVVPKQSLTGYEGSMDVAACTLKIFQLQILIYFKIKAISRNSHLLQSGAE